MKTDVAEKEKIVIFPMFNIAIQTSFETTIRVTINSKLCYGFG